MSVVVPLHDELENLERLVREVHAALEGREHELVLVDDGSTDGTAERLEVLAERDAGLHAVRLSRRFGKESAIAAGLDAAKGEAVVLMDGDLQHPPSLLPELVERWEEGADVVNAVKSEREKRSPLYRLGAGAFYRLMGHAVRPGFERRSDFKLLDRQVVDVLAACGERTRFFRGLVEWVGFRVAEVPFEVAPRAGGRTKWTGRGLARYSLRNLIAFSSVPLIAIAWLGFLTTGFGLLLAIQTFWNWARGVAVSGFTTTILSVLIMGGAILSCLGVVAVYLAVIYDEIKARPLFVVRRPRGGDGRDGP